MNAPELDPWSIPTYPERIADHDPRGRPEYAARVATEGAFATIERLQRVLERVIRHRDALREENAQLLKCARHWFVNDPKAHGCCAACALPETNARHAKRAA